jgi:hypothetical protein
MEEHGHVVDLEVVAENCLFVEKLFLLPLSPFLEKELALVPDLLSDVAMGRSRVQGGGEDLAANGKLAAEAGLRGKGVEGQVPALGDAGELAVEQLHFL